MFDFEYDWVVSTKGVFTDSKVYAGVIPECINLGCFYSKQHTPDEVVDVKQLEVLVHAAININWTALIASGC